MVSSAPFKVKFSAYLYQVFHVMKPESIVCVLNEYIQQSWTSQCSVKITSHQVRSARLYFVEAQANLL